MVLPIVSSLNDSPFEKAILLLSRLTLLLIVSLFLGHSANAQSNKQEKPNFIIIFVDDQGYQDLGCYGASDIKTPRIDRMAKEGMLFTDFYSQRVGGPSRAA